jgi:hypothetical protein
MPLTFTQRKQEEVPSAGSNGKVNEDLLSIKNEMAKLGSGLILEIETGSEKSIRGTKMLVTKAAKELGTPWRHWHSGSSVFAQPVDGTRRRGRPRKTD